MHTDPNCGAGFATTPFDFSAGGYFDWASPGTLSKTYFDASFSGHDVTISLSGNTATLGNSPGTGNATPSIDNALTATNDALSFLTSGIGSGNSNITIDIQFSPAIPGDFGFEVYHINRSGGGDRIKITADQKNGGSINPIFTASATPSYSFIGQNEVNATTFTEIADGQLGVNFLTADSIESITIVWMDCNGCPAATHGLAIGNFDFCRLFLDEDGDGIEDRLDVDDDNDGITDAMEACGNSYLNPDQDTIEVEITLDNFPEETTWRLEDFYGNLLASGGPYSNPADIGRVIRESVIMDADLSAVLRVYDTFGDALTVGGSGGYRVLRNNTVIAGPVTSNWGFDEFEAITAVGAAYNEFSCLSTDYSADDDKDGVRNYQDPDYCTLNSNGVCASLDNDGDGIIDPFDLDADNDGIRDDIEAQGSACYVVPSASVDDRGLPSNFVNYTNCADNSTASTYGVIPNQDSDDSDATPDYLDLDTDGDGIADFAEGFDFNTDGQSVDDYIGFSNAFAPTGGSTASYPNGVDSDNDRIPDWLDNLPLSPGFDQSQLPPFQDPSNASFYFDTDGDGIVDLFDTDNGGSQPALPPDTDSDANPDWRDLDNNISLPVEFAGFTARLKDQRDGQVQWTTSIETGLSHFEVYRSADGINFSLLGEMPAAGESRTLTQYEFLDAQVALNLEDHAFYRLHAVDKDGTVTETEVQAIYFGNAEPTPTLTVYPNPAENHLNIHLTGIEHSVEFSLYDATGRLLWQENRPPADVMELARDVSALDRGMYLLVVAYQGRQETKKIMIQ